MLIALLLVAIPAATLLTLYVFPSLDGPLILPVEHFYIVSAASLLAAAVCVALVVSARSFRETRILFLTLCFFSLALIFSIHGLTTPGHLYHHVSSALTRSPYLATLAAAIFAALSVVSLPKFLEHSKLRISRLALGVPAGLIVLYFVISLAYPDWLTDFPTTEQWFRNLLTAITITLLAFAAWRYFQSYLFARLPGQLAMAAGLVLLAESQVSLNFFEVWHLSWWVYHFLFLVAFVTVLVGWALELHRAKDVKAIAEALVMRDALTQLNRGRPDSVVALADEIEARDLATFRHVDRVAAYAYMIGQELGLGPARLRDLVLAGQLHDVGKIGLPTYILTKPGKLTPEEWEIIQQHPHKGWEIANRTKKVKTLAHVIRHHHERFDGKGYPDGLAGEEIPLEARIISVADTFDAVTSERPYRPVMSIDDAKAELNRVAGTQLDPTCVQALLKALETGRPVTLGDSAAVPIQAPAT